MAQESRRQFLAAPYSIPLRQLADGEVEWSRYSRLRNDVQSLPPGNSGASAALRGASSVHPGAGIVVWRFDHRSSDQEYQPRARRFALWNLANVSRIFRSHYHSLPAEISFPSVAFFWHAGDVQHSVGLRNIKLAHFRQDYLPHRRHDAARSADDVLGRSVAGGPEYAGRRTAWRNAGAALSRAYGARSLFCRSRAAGAE